MSAFLVLAIVSIVAFAALRVSMNIFLRIIDQYKRDDKSKKFIRNLALIISPVIWLALYFFPVDYGPVPRNLNIWIMAWSVKTILYFMAPALVAVIATMVLERKK